MPNLQTNLKTLKSSFIPVLLLFILVACESPKSKDGEVTEDAKNSADTTSEALTTFEITLFVDLDTLETKPLESSIRIKDYRGESSRAHVKDHVSGIKGYQHIFWKVEPENSAQTSRIWITKITSKDLPFKLIETPALAGRLVKAKVIETSDTTILDSYNIHFKYRDADENEHDAVVDPKLRMTMTTTSTASTSKE